MGFKNLEEFNHNVEVQKTVLGSMPVNNQKNLSVYKEKVAEIKEEYSAYKDQLFEEIKKRSSKYLKMEPNAKIKDLEKELLGFKDLRLFNPINTPYEKLGMDNIIYSLTHYYKIDLEEVNGHIKKLFEIFKMVGIELSEADFLYSPYAKIYMHELLADDDFERMKDVFEDVHWKCPDVILHIAMTFRILYYRHMKEFEAYLDNKRKEILDANLTYDDYVLKRDNISKELYFLKNYDTAAVINKFMNGELMLNDYSIVNVDKCLTRFLGDEKPENIKDMIGDFQNISYNLEEYENYLRFQYILEDAKKKYAERSGHLGNSEKVRKEIVALENELSGLREAIDTGSKKGFLFFKKKVDVDSSYVTLNEKMKELEAKCEEYDKEIIYEKMNESIIDTSSVYDVFNFALSFKSYLRNCIKESDENVSIDVVKRQVGDFEDFLNNPNINVIKNISFLGNDNIAYVIADHYKMVNINISTDNLDIDAIESYLKDLDIIIHNYYLDINGLDINFIINLFECKKIIDEEKAK